MINLTGKIPQILKDKLVSTGVIVDNLVVGGNNIDVTFSNKGTPTTLTATFVGNGKWVVDELEDSANLFPQIEEGDSVSLDMFTKLFINSINSSLILSFNPLGRVKYGVKDVATKVGDVAKKVGKAVGDWAVDKVDADQAQKAIRKLGKCRTTYIDPRDDKKKTGSFSTTGVNVGKIESLGKMGHYKVLTGNPATQDFQVFHLYRNGNKYRILDAKTGLEAEEAKWVYTNNIPKDYTEADWKNDGSNDFMKQLDDTEEDNVTEAAAEETTDTKETSNTQTEDNTNSEEVSEEEDNVEDGHIETPEEMLDGEWSDTDVVMADDEEDNVQEVVPKKSKSKKSVKSSNNQNDEEDNVIESTPTKKRKKSKYNGCNVTGYQDGMLGTMGTMAASSLQYITEDLKQFIEYTGKLKDVDKGVKEKWDEVKQLLLEISMYDKDVLKAMTEPSDDNLTIDFNQTGTGQNYTITVDFTPNRFNVIDKVAPDNAYEHLIKSLETVRDKLAPKV